MDNTGHVEFDGFYRTRTYRCGCGDFDNDSRRDLMAVYDFFGRSILLFFNHLTSQTGSRRRKLSRSLFSRIALPSLLVLAALALRMTIDGDREDYAVARLRPCLQSYLANGGCFKVGFFKSCGG